MAKVALIVGIDSHRGISLARLLGSQPINFSLHAFVHWKHIEEVRQRLAQELPSLHVILHTPSATDATELVECLKEVEPTHIYHLQSRTPSLLLEPHSHEHPLHCDGVETLRLVEALRLAKLASTRFFEEQRVSELDIAAMPCRFQTPSSCSKLFSYWTIRHYRDVHGVFAVNGSFFDKTLSCEDTCEDTLFADDISKRLALQIMELKEGKRKFVELELHTNETACSKGCIDGVLDKQYEWAHGADLADAMWLSLNEKQTQPRDYVFSTQQFYSLRNFLKEAFSKILDNKETSLEWQKVSNQLVTASALVNGKKTEIIKITAVGSETAGNNNNNNGNSQKTSNGNLGEILAKTSAFLQWKPTRTFGDIVEEYFKEAGRKTVQSHLSSANTDDNGGGHRVTPTMPSSLLDLED